MLSLHLYVFYIFSWGNLLTTEVKVGFVLFMYCSSSAAPSRQYSFDRKRCTLYRGVFRGESGSKWSAPLTIWRKKVKRGENWHRFNWGGGVFHILFCLTPPPLLPPLNLNSEYAPDYSTCYIQSTFRVVSNGVHRLKHFLLDNSSTVLLSCYMVQVHGIVRILRKPLMITTKFSLKWNASK